MPFYKKRLRLSPADYIGRGTYFVTLGTENRAKFFADPSTGQWFLEKQKH